MSKKNKDPLDIEIGSRLLHFRENIVHATREAFAAKTTLSLPFVYDFEVGNKGLSAKSIKKIVEAYSASHGLTSDYLIFGYTNEMLRSITPIECKMIETHLEDALNILKEKNTD